MTQNDTKTIPVKWTDRLSERVGDSISASCQLAALSLGHQSILVFFALTLSLPLWSPLKSQTLRAPSPAAVMTASSPNAQAVTGTLTLSLWSSSSSPAAVTRSLGIGVEYFAEKWTDYGSKETFWGVWQNKSSQISNLLTLVCHWSRWRPHYSWPPSTRHR